MNDIILHHYPTSPFSEKVRLVLGMKRMRWHSVIVPVIMPKPDVVALTGGYRRTPFMQIGADIYCDSALMCRVIDRIAPTPPLYPPESAGLAEIVAQWADSSLFWTAVPYTCRPSRHGAHLRRRADRDAARLRRRSGGDEPDNAARPAARRRRARRRTSRRLELMLADDRPFLLRAVSASIADSSAAQSIWFVRRAPPVAAGFAVSEGRRLVRADRRVPGTAVDQFGGDEALALAARAGGHAPAQVAAGQGFAVGDAR